MTPEQWDDLGTALTKVLTVFIIILFITLVVASLATAPAHAMRPTYSPGPSWKDCSEMVPVPRAEDGSMYMVCTRADNGRRYEVVYRSIAGSRVCTEVAPKQPDGYQHFMCEEKFELMMRPEPKK